MPTSSPFYDTTTADLPVRGFLHRADTPSGALVLTHGAGSNCNAQLLVALAEAFSAAGLTVLRCDLPFRQLRPHGPPPPKSAERDQDGLRAAIAALRREMELGASGLESGTWPQGDLAETMQKNFHRPQIFLGGHSYGGRQASLLAASDRAVADALLLLSFPLHPPQRPTQLRSGHFPNLTTPACFVHGMRDGFATDSEIMTALQLIPAPTHLLSIPSAGHELLSPRNRSTLPQQIVDEFIAFARPN